VIVVVGSPVGRVDGRRIVADGSSARIAMAAATAGRSVQIVGRVGDDATADAVLQDLARAGVGHVAILRDPARATPVVGDGGATPPEVDGADVDLALRYLTDFRVIVLIEPATDAVNDVVARATDWGAAALIVATPDGTETEAAFVGRVAAQAVRLDIGPAPAA
jgi:hypothetical protein